MWFWFVLAVIGYFIFKERLDREIKKIKKWLEENKDKIKEWMKVEEIKRTYEELIKEIKRAGMDKKWTVLEIITVLSLAVRLMELIKQYEEEKL